MKRILTYLLLLLPLFADAQSRKAEFYTDESSAPCASWWVSPSTVIKFDSATGSIMHCDLAGGHVQAPVLWLKDIHHICFRTDLSSVNTLHSHGPGKWRLAEGGVREALEIIPPEDFVISRPIPLAIYDTNGILQGGAPSWTGDPLRVAVLTPGLYLLKIANLSTLSFFKL